jgi:hypothetical protein
LESTLERYGPSGHHVAQYIEDLSAGFWFDQLGKPDPADGTVLRLWERASAAAAMGYSLTDDGSEGELWDLEAATADTRLLRFFAMLSEIDSQNVALVGANGLQHCLQNAVDDALDKLHEVHPEEEDHFEFIGVIPEERSHEWEFTTAAHCEHIATELVVAHLTPIHLFRDMWYWYSRGHWPCGWEGEWPEGRLMVF